MHLLKCLDLCASYGSVRALKSMSLHADGGEIVGLCGPNKAGKSTLARCLAGVKTPDHGKIEWNGRDVTGLPPWKRRSTGISLCPEGRGIYQEMSVQDNLDVGGDGLAPSLKKDRIDEVLTYFPLLKARLGQQAMTLSGGEAQMLGIAKKLLRHPDLLIIDEPCLGLDPQSIEKVLSAVKQLRRNRGMTVLLIEEGLNRLEGWVDRAYVLHRGEVVGHGQLAELAEMAAVSAAFLGEVGGKLR